MIEALLGNVNELYKVALQAVPDKKKHSVCQAWFTLPGATRRRVFKKLGIPEAKYDKADLCLKQIADALSDLTVMSVTKGSVDPDPGID